MKFDWPRAVYAAGDKSSGTMVRLPSLVILPSDVTFAHKVQVHVCLLL